MLKTISCSGDQSMTDIKPEVMQMEMKHKNFGAVQFNAKMMHVHFSALFNQSYHTDCY